MIRNSTEDSAKSNLGNQQDMHSGKKTFNQQHQGEVVSTQLLNLFLKNINPSYESINSLYQNIINDLMASRNQNMTDLSKAIQAILTD